MRISDWSSDVCSSDLCRKFVLLGRIERARLDQAGDREHGFAVRHPVINLAITVLQVLAGQRLMNLRPEDCRTFTFGDQQMNELFLEDLDRFRSEEHTSELQSLMRISYAVFCLNKKNKN